MRIIHYPHPTLMRTSKPLKRVDAELQHMVRQMFDVMYEHRGVGLAANQVNLPYRLFVMNVESDPALPDQEQVFINPVLSHPKGSHEAEEGCLSLPELYAPVKRPKKIVVNAYNLAGQEVRYELDDLPSRIVQHEYDHLDGVLFIDRISPTARISIKEQLDDFAMDFDSRRRQGEIPSDAEILARLDDLEKQRT